MKSFVLRIYAAQKLGLQEQQLTGILIDADDGREQVFHSREELWAEIQASTEIKKAADE